MDEKRYAGYIFQTKKNKNCSNINNRKDKLNKKYRYRDRYLYL